MVRATWVVHANKFEYEVSKAGDEEKLMGRSHDQYTISRVGERAKLTMIRTMPGLFSRRVQTPATNKIMIVMGIAAIVR